MKIYKVDYFVYDLANSLLPPRDPEPGEEVQYEEARFAPQGKELVALFIRLGYTPYQAEHLYRALVNHYWYDYGIRETRHINTLIYSWQRSYLAPAWAQAADKPPPILPPAWVAAAVIIGAVLVVVLLVAPDWEEEYKWRPPCNLYLGVYKTQLWWMTLAGVSAKQRPFYKALVYQGSCIAAHTYVYIAPPVITDRLHFWGTLDFRCWQIPWFRVYRTQYADCTFVGFLENMGGGNYKLREPFADHWAPRGPMTVSPEDYCTTFSPCG